MMVNQNDEVVEVKVEPKVEEDEDDEEGPPPGYQTILKVPKIEAEPLPHSQPPQTDTATPNTSELSQLVCGSCRRLLKYPLGAIHVQCSCCQIVNFVLQAHQVGQVKCMSCTVLLMYPYGAPQVKCSSCQSVTEIGQHNHRPPLSVQQRRQLSSLKSSQ